MKMLSQAMRRDTTVLAASVLPRYVCFCTAAGTPARVGPGGSAAEWGIGGPGRGEVGAMG